jgi:hypothetical protein
VPEPTTTTAASTGAAWALLIWLFGPAAPDVMLVIGAAAIGALHSAGKRPTPGAGAFAGHVMLWTLTAALFTGVAVWALTKYLGIPADRWPGCVAFVIAFLAHRWQAWWEQIGDAVVGMLARRAGGASPPTPPPANRAGQTGEGAP